MKIDLIFIFIMCWGIIVNDSLTNKYEQSIFKGITINLLSINLLSINSNQSNRVKIPITNPIDLKYEYYKISKLEDGTSANLFIEKGKKNHADGDYVWTKAVPIYASYGIKYVFEYQMDYSALDMKALIFWLQKNIGEKVKGGSIDRPYWYKQDMTLSEVFEYCKKNNEKITMGYYNESTKSMALVILDTGSITTQTSAEIGLVYIIYNQ